MRFQYSLTANISLADKYLTLIFGMYVDRHELKKQGSLTGFLKKFSFGEMDHFWPKNCASSKLWIRWKNFLKLLHNEKGQWAGESNNNGLYPKNFVQVKWVILGSKMAHSHSSGLALRIFLKFCRIKSFISFRGKNHSGQFDLFSLEAIIYCLIGHGQIEPDHC